MQQFKQCPYRAAEYKKTLKDGKLLYDMEGPWCDIWSMGVMLLQLILVKGLAVREVFCYTKLTSLYQSLNRYTHNAKITILLACRLEC